MDITYDEDNDIGYIHLAYPRISGGLRTLTSKDDLFNFDYDGDGELIGIEFFSLKEIIRVLESNIDLEY